MKTSHLLSFALLTSMSPAAYAQYITSGTLYVDLRATNSSAGSLVWQNEASGFGADMNFTNAIGVMNLSNNVNGTSIPGVLFNSSAYLGPRTVADLEGASDRSIEVWVLNPAVGPEETLVAWAHRGGAPDGSNLSMNYGTDLVFGAAGHWGGNYDMGWAQAANIPTANQWHHLVYTYDGNTNVQMYVDGSLRTGKATATTLRTWANEAMMIGGQRASTNSAANQLPLTAYINSIRVHGGRLTPTEIAANFEAGPVIPPTGVILRSQPRSLLVGEGVPANFAITKLGTAPVYYQWYRDGVPVPDATNASYTIASPVVGDSGANFSVIASNFVNGTAYTATSSVAQLTVLSPSQSLLHRYSFTSDANDSVGGAPGTLQGTASVSGGQLRLPGTAGSFLNLPTRLTDGLAATTVEFWASFGANGNFARTFDFGHTNGNTGIRYMFFTHRAGASNVLRQAVMDPIAAEKNISTTIPGTVGATFDFRTNVHVAVTFDPQSGFMGFYTNGALAASRNDLVTLTNVDNVYSYIGRSLFAADAPLNASIDEFRIYSTRISAAQIASNFLNGPDVGFTNVPVNLVVDVADRTIAATDTAQLFVTASGEGPIGFQWFRDGVPVSGATNRNYAVANANLNDSGAQFSCVMSNYITSSSTAYVITSRVATLTVLGPGGSLTHRYKFDTDPNDSVGTAHGVLTNSVAGSPPAKLTNGAVAMSGAGAYVDLPNNIVQGYTSFTVEAWVTDNGSGAWARIADFGNSTAGEGAAGNGTTYFFLSSPTAPGGLRGAITEGSGEQLLDLNPTPLTFGVQKHVAWTTDARNGTAALYVDGTVVRFTNIYTLTPAGMGPTVNNWLGRAQFSADAPFNGRIHEFRIYDSALPPGAIRDSFLLGPDYVAADGPPQFPLQPVSRTVNESDSTTFNAIVVGRRPLTVQWYRDGVPIPNATNTSYTLASATTNDHNAVFQLWATNNVNGTTHAVGSATAALAVNPDTNAPVVLRAQNIGSTTVEILFSEPMAESLATNVANYAIGSFVISNATISADGRIVLLTTEPLIVNFGVTLTVSNLTDRAATANTLTPNPTVIAFAVLPYALQEIGSPAGLGSLTFNGGGYNVIGSGLGAGNGSARTNDQLTLAYQNLSGNFDIQARLGSLNLSDAWARAGLMARDGFNSNATFAATWATPTVAGAFFQSRTAVNGATTIAGNFPVNYPDTWIRLRRTGNVFDGFASVDGQAWSFLGTATITMPATIQVGLAVSANSSSGNLAAQFRNIGAGAGTIATNLVLPFEPLAASSRKTALVFSEIMYNPPDAWGATNNLEWVEMHNTGVAPEDLTGHELRGDISYDFPNGTTILPGEFLLVARNPAAFAAHYPGVSALGPWSGNLGNNGGTLRLNNELNGRMLEVEYDNEAPWPVGADGTGHSLVLRKPSYGESSASAWTHSSARGGSPGRIDPALPAVRVVINEFEQTTNGFVELKNVTGSSVDISGYILTDNVDTNRYVFPPSSSIGGGANLSVDAATLGFSPDATDGHLYLLAPNGNVLDAIEFGAYAGAARGRYPDGSQYWSEMGAATPATANGPLLQRDLVINEIMYHPISESNNDEYIEVYNRSTNAISLANWRVRGGIDFNFPSNASIAAGGYVVVAENLTNLLAKYTNLTTANTFGNYNGSLANGGERVALQIPVLAVFNTTNGPVTNLTHTTINEVTYRDGGRWGQYADGGGSSLELIDPRADNRFAGNWADSDETTKAPWTTIDNTAFLLNGQTDQNGAIIPNGAPNRLEIFLQDAGEVLVDNLEMRNNGGANLIANTGFESGTNGFFFGGTHRRSFVQAGVGVTGNALHVVSTGRGDAGPNRIAAPITQLVVNNPLQTGGPNATNTGTMRAQVRWLKGSPYIMLRTRGHWMETTLRLNLPATPGTPGAANSRFATNTGPAISETTHNPVLPAAGQPVVVTARVTDPDGVGGVTLRWRVDLPGNAGYTNVAMVDNGTAPDTLAGDGIYSGTIAGFAANSMVAFNVIATDAAPVTVSAIFPNGFPTQECLVRFGETQIAGGLGTYRLWVTTNNVNVWSTEGTAPGQREINANDPIDATFVYGASRVVYNVGTHYSGSPFHTLNAPYRGPGVPDTPVCDYEVNFPSDDKFLGTEPFVLAAFDVNQAVGTFFADRAVQNEFTGNWIGRKLGQQYNHRRHVHVVFNGSRRGTIYEDAQQPNGDMLDEYYPNDTRGELRKIEDWFEFQDNGQTFTVNTRNDIGSQSAYLLRVNDNSGAVDSKRYRWTFRPRSTDNPNDWFNLTNLVVAANTPGNGPAYVSNVLAWVDMPNFLRPIAVHHLCGDWDSYGYERGKNMFAYKPDNDGWKLLMWDVELGLGHSQSRSPLDGIYRAPHEPIITRWFTQVPAFQREYLCALLEACNGPMAPGVADPLLDARYASFLQNNLPVISADYIKSFMGARREYVLAQIPNVPFGVDGPAFFETTNVVITFTGTAPVSVKDIVLGDGRDVAPTWTTVSNWSGNVTLAPGTNTLVFRALDADGNEIGSVTVIVVFTGEYPWPQLRINEWMAANTSASGFSDPADGDFDDWFEIFNPTASAVDLTGWYLSDTPTNKTQYLVPGGYVIPAGGYLLVWADNETGQNSTMRPDLHANFALRQAGEDIVLTAPDGTIIDHVTFGQQTNNISQGRSPNGGTNITFQFVPTPRGSNYFVVPVITDVIATNGVLAFTFSTTPGHTYRVEYKDDLNALTWNQLGSDQLATGPSLAVVTAIGANPQRFFRARVMD